MNARAELLLHVLCLCVRGLTTGQAMRLLGIRDEANYRRFLKPLVAAGLVNVVRMLAKPVPEMSAPLWPCEASVAEVVGGVFERVLYLAWKRWADVSAVLMPCVVATRKAGQLYGVKRSGLLAKPLQATHDLAVAEVLLTILHDRLIHVQHWQGEDGCHDTTLGDKRVDALITRNVGTSDPKVIEVVGADYTHDKLLAIHRECNSRGLTYELW